MSVLVAHVVDLGKTTTWRGTMVFGAVSGFTSDFVIFASSAVSFAMLDSITPAYSFPAREHRSKASGTF